MGGVKGTQTNNERLNTALPAVPESGILNTARFYKFLLRCLSTVVFEEVGNISVDEEHKQSAIADRRNLWILSIFES